MGDETQTGIEVTYAISESMKIAAGVFHFLHLDSVGKAVWRGMEFVYTLDGTEVTAKAELKHVIPCAPGEHTLSVAVHNTLYGKVDTTPAFSRATLKLTVPPKGLVRVTYRPKNFAKPVPLENFNATLELTP
jgi:hypothetical protein